MADLPTSPTTQEKKRLREQYLEQRQSISGTRRLQASRAVAQHFADHPILAFAPSFAGYASMRGELDILPLFEHMTRYGKTTALARMDSATQLLSFHRWSPGDALEISSWGVREPRADTPSLIPQIILTPLLAFDARGFRLGYGGGWYDRTIATLRRHPHPPLFIGVGYAAQEAAHLPTLPTDAPLDGILTEFGVSMFTHP